MYSPANFCVFSGPFGNGKTRHCVKRIEYLMQTAPVYYPVSRSRGVRRTRGAILAGTYPRLRRTILKDIREWFPPGAAKISKSPPHEGEIRFGDKDGNECICELFAFAGDSDTFYDDFGSTALTWAYFVEIQTMARWDFVSLGIDRTGRFKPEGSGGHPLGKLVFGCMNWRDTRHWTYDKLIRSPLPPNWALFKGPHAFRHVALDELDSVTLDEGKMLKHVFGVSKFEQLPVLEYRQTPGYWIPNPFAENINNIETKMDIMWRIGDRTYRHRPPEELQGMAYYWDMCLRAESDEHLTRFVMGEPAASRSGKPVYPKFNRRHHVSKTPLRPIDGSLICGTDPGLEHVSFLIAQVSHDGELRVLREIIGENMTLEDFRDHKLLPVLQRDFPHHRRDMIVINDLTGDRQDRGTGMTWADYLGQVNIQTQPAMAHEYAIRQNALNHYLTRHDLITIDPSCTVLIDGLDGAYTYPQIQGTDSYRDRPNKKTVYSAPVDALESITTYLRSEGDDEYVSRQRQQSAIYNFG